MTNLKYSTYVAPSKPAVSNDLPPGELRRMWSPTAATLIHGERDAVLVDPLMTAAEGEDLAGWIAATGKTLTTIFVTHGHGDHFFGAAPVLDRFPEARMIATPAVVEGMKLNLTPAWLDGFWRTRFPGQLPDRLIVADPLQDDRFTLEGEELIAVELGHTDTDGTSALHVPSIGLLVAGDAVYDDVHLYLAESVAGGIDNWLAALDVLEGLRPTAVVSGHRQADASDDPRYIEETRQYLKVFAEADKQTASAVELYEAILAAYPDRLNRGVLWNSVHAVKRGRHG
ncbi:glyoxylase-like metal-dependent hydrolase (beta-lactamase superfamily II) [Kribbella pratensis]|uniref:Glyoxylase-like metal-dependent hydrolase (Beta-lactamase superfamily II) n=1 Tax=Kribbella pratensis TaxID=2512112 RepID=A0ABY2FKE7_9ACTN|nr:MBL fold metallo-hydrolase [Kribbella pratensis]TDW93604.1 glyoxylase-like metal-dependent hydrolase (beta-lactamase superfamily II) [Kribbella pratensis]